MTDEKAPTLIDAEGMGGRVALDGFDYQLWDAMTRLPAWLRNPAFEAMIFEGLEDVEARFFAPAAPQHRVLERYQAKSATLTPAEVQGVFERFLEFEHHHPNVARVHTLVTPMLPSTLRWIRRVTTRVRDARPFYAPFAVITANSDVALEKRLIDHFGQPLGQLIANVVEVEERTYSRDTAIAGLGAALAHSFPTAQPTYPRITSAFDALDSYVRANVGKSLPRARILEVLESELSIALIPARTLALHVRSDRNGTDESVLEIDASRFSGSGGDFPDAQAWSDELIDRLLATARWLTAGGGSHRIGLRGSYRLSTAFALGWSFRSATGFELEIPTKDGPWCTDDRPDSESDVSLQVRDVDALDGSDLVVSVGVLRRPADTLGAAGLEAPKILDLFVGHPITSAKHAQSAVSRIKDLVCAAVSRLQPRRIRLYFAGPAALAVALGHRWNALPATQLHEFNSERMYTPTALLS